MTFGGGSGEILRGIAGGFVLIWQRVGFVWLYAQLMTSIRAITSQAPVAVVIAVWVPLFSLLPSCLSGSLGGVFLEKWSASLVVSLLAVAVSAALTIEGPPSARYLIYFVIAACSAFTGEWIGFQKWGCSVDPIGRSWLPSSFWLGAVLVALCELAGAWLLRRAVLRLPIHLRWLTLFACCAYGPAMLVATPFIVPRSLDREKSLAIERLTATGTGFSRPDWEQITVRYVEAAQARPIATSAAACASRRDVELFENLSVTHVT